MNPTRGKIKNQSSRMSQRMKARTNGGQTKREVGWNGKKGVDRGGADGRGGTVLLGGCSKVQKERKELQVMKNHPRTARPYLLRAQCLSLQTGGQMPLLGRYIVTHTPLQRLGGLHETLPLR